MLAFDKIDIWNLCYKTFNYAKKSHGFAIKTVCHCENIQPLSDIWGEGAPYWGSTITASSCKSISVKRTSLLHRGYLKRSETL